MLVKASVARSPNQLAQHVRQKVLVAAVARGVPTINDLLKRADEDKSGALSYKEFYTTLRKLLQLTAAAVTDDAVRQTFKVIDKTGDGALSREEFATFLRGKNTSDDAQLVDCLDAKNKLAARQAALRREARLKLLRKRLRKAVQLHGAFFENHDTEWSLDEFLEVVRTTLALGAHAITDADVDMVFRELSDGDKLHPDAVARFVNPEKPAPEKENAAPPHRPRRYTVAPRRLVKTEARPRQAASIGRRDAVEVAPRPSRRRSLAHPRRSPRRPRRTGGTRRRQPALSPGGRADMLLGARDALGRAAEALAASDTAAEDSPAELAVAFEQLRQLCVRVAAAADGVATLAATIKRKRGAQSLAKSVSFSDDVVTPLAPERCIHGEPQLIDANTLSATFFFFALFSLLFWRISSPPARSRLSTRTPPRAPSRRRRLRAASPRPSPRAGGGPRAPRPSTAAAFPPVAPRRIPRARRGPRSCPSGSSARRRRFGPWPGRTPCGRSCSRWSGPRRGPATTRHISSGRKKWRRRVASSPWRPSGWDSSRKP